MRAVVGHPVQPQDLHHGVAEAALGLRGTALHEHYHWVRAHQPLHRLARALTLAACGGARTRRRLAERPRRPPRQRPQSRAQAAQRPAHGAEPPTVNRDFAALPAPPTGPPLRWIGTARERPGSGRVAADCQSLAMASSNLTPLSKPRLPTLLSYGKCSVASFGLDEVDVDPLQLPMTSYSARHPAYSRV